MTTIVTQDFRTELASLFVESVAEPAITATASKNVLYFALGRSTDWTGGSDTPHVPVDVEQDQVDLRSDLIVVESIPTYAVRLCLPRITWTSANTYTPNVTTDGWRVQSYYVISSTNNVYECIVAGGGVVANEPTHVSGTVAEADGYTWQYLYTITGANLLNLLTDNYIPLPIQDDVTGASASLDAALTLTDINHRLATNLVIIKHQLIMSTTDFQFRQISVFTNMRKINTSAAATDDIPGVGATDLDDASGSLLYFENRLPLSRVSAQTETLSVVLDF